MATIPQAMQTFIESLNLTPKQDEDARAQRDRLLEGLKQSKQLSVKQALISGSFGRGTAIRPLHDIDLFLVLEPTHHGDPRSVPPSQVLDQVEGALRDLHPQKAPRRQARSVNIEFSGTGVGYDIVPALPDTDPEVFWIPDHGRWLRTNPRRHKEHAVAANARAAGKALSLVRALKAWHTGAGQPLRSFHLELMAYEVLTSDPGPYDQALAMLFERLPDRVHLPCPDPAGLSGDVAAGTPPKDLQDAVEALRSAARSAQDAVAQAQRGAPEVAHARWRGLFGGYYPESGRVPSAVSTAPDAPHSRFG